MTKDRSPARGRRQLQVRHSTGHVQPFLRGMLTHDLVQRGLSFESAYATARSVRDALGGIGEISTEELKQLVEETVASEFPEETLAPTPSSLPNLEVTYGGEPQPFSRGLLAQSLHAVGLAHDRAYRLVLDLQESLLKEGTRRLDSTQLARRTAEMLERREGREVAGRYRLMRRIRQLHRPLVVYVGGATGTGKSTLAVDLAPLLRIYRINSTDTIREVMRLAFSPAMLPALHRSSFEVSSEDPYLPSQPVPDDLAIARAFEEQALRISVGVRAVVERAIAENTSILVEGVHLVPPLVPFADLEGAAYQVAIMLTTQDEEVHRSHLLARSRLSGRRAERYLDHFPAIRKLQDLLLHRAEEHEIPLLDTTDRERSAQDAVLLISGVLQQRLPSLAAPESPEVKTSLRALLLIIDGLADRPLKALGGRTPLEAARTPTLDRLAAEGRVGLADPVAPGVVPDTASGTLSIFGQPPQAMKRGAIEAIGAGLELPPGAVALRGNLATLDDRGWVRDRRAGRIREGTAELAAALDGLALPGRHSDDVEIRVRAATEHRIAVALIGEDLSPRIVGSDPGEVAVATAPLTPRPLNPEDEAAVRTARVLALFEQEARRVLQRHMINLRRMQNGLAPANCVLTRGPGRLHFLAPAQPHGMALRLACVSGDRTVQGIARILGGTVFATEAMTANLDTDLAGKFEAARQLLERHDLVVLHVKGADVAAHDGRPDRKLDFLERLDHELGRFLEEVGDDLRLAVASDHATYSDSGQHGPDPVPFLIWGAGIEADEVQRFDERTAAAGSLQRIPLQLVLERLFDLE